MIKPLRMVKIRIMEEKITDIDFTTIEKYLRIVRIIRILHIIARVHKHIKHIMCKSVQ